MFGLKPEQYFLFLETHVKHLKAMGQENQKKYCLSKIRNIVWDENEQTVNVYYDDNWWHYDKNGNWY
jgi:hypothetical protein